MSSPAAKRMRLSASRTSLSGRSNLENRQSALPRPASSTLTSRLGTSQPTYDFITGGEAEEPVKRSILRQSVAVRPDNSNEENLRAKINSLDYELKNLQQERGLLILQHGKELRDVQAKADVDFKKYQAAESAAQKAAHRCDTLAKELREAQDKSTNEKATLERQVRDAQDQNAALKDDAEEAQARLSDQERQFNYQLNDIDVKRAALQETVDQLREEVIQTSTTLDSTQTQLAQRDAEIETLETRIAELKTHADDTGALAVLQNQLSDQIAHIRKLEMTNREQVAELQSLRDAHRSVQVVEEQRRSLETELQVLKDVERQLGEAQIQKEILEDEKRTWMSLLESEGDSGDFDSPEAVIRALVQQRIEYASMVDRVGNVETELSEKDEIIKSLEADRSSWREQLIKAKESQFSQPEKQETKACQRLDRQRILATKEVEYLRAQLKTFDTEETILMENQNFDAQRIEQVKQLELLVDQYKSEVQALHSDLTRLESASASSLTELTESRGVKRPAENQNPEEDSSAQMGPLLRKNKNLQVALQKTAQQSQMLATELQAAKTQLKSLRESSKTRILELRDNPTTKAEAIKQSTLRTLKDENTSLLAQLRGEDLQGVGVVPVSTVDALKLDLQDMEKVVAEKEKRMRRQREIWTEKAAEFRDVVASVLGYRVNFLPNGKAKVASMFYGKRREAGEDSDEEDEHYIIFDGDNGTMKISGGPDGAFGTEVKDLVNFWVKEKKEIPCFLAAMTLEFYEKFGGEGGR